MKINDSYEDYLKRREGDEKGEKIIGAYLDAYLYPYITSTNKRNTYDKDKQYTGEDVWLTSGDTYMVVDEKAAIRYANRRLDTFAIELSLKNRKGKEFYGWFMDENQTSTDMSLIWVNSAQTDSDNVLVDSGSVYDVTVAIVDKDAIKKYLLERGWNEERLNVKIRQIRQFVDDIGADFWKDTAIRAKLGSLIQNGMQFFCTSGAWEKTINVLLPKQELIKMSTCAYRVLRQNNEVKRILLNG